eukprot:3828957-Prymnesium_polylepis.2
MRSTSQRCTTRMSLPTSVASTASLTLMCVGPARRSQSSALPTAFPIALYGLWPVVRHKAVLERYAALRCLWHG